MIFGNYGKISLFLDVISQFCTKKASSYIVMGVAGGAFSPMLMGYIGEENMALGFIVPLIAFLYILYFAIKCKR